MKKFRATIEVHGTSASPPAFTEGLRASGGVQRRGLAGPGASCDNLLMTITVDQKRRAVIPFKPGDVLEIVQQSPDVVVLKRTKQGEDAKPKLVRRSGHLVFVGAPTTTKEVKRLLEDFP